MHLSAASIRKNFPLSYPDFPLGNLQRRKSQYSAPSKPSTIGVEWKVDFKGKWTGPDGRLSPTFQQQLYLHIGKDFVETYTDISYRIYDIVHITSSSSLPTLCLQFFDISSSFTPSIYPSIF